MSSDSPLRRFAEQLDAHGDTRSGQLETFMNHRYGAEREELHKPNKTNSDDDPKVQENICSDTISVLEPFDVESCRKDSNLNLHFNNKIFGSYQWWHAVKKEHSKLLMKHDCTEEETTQKLELRKAVKEKCIEFLEGAKQKDLIGEGTYGEVWTMKLNENEQSPLLIQKVCRRISTYCVQMEVLILSTFTCIKYLPKLIYSGYMSDGKWCIIMEYFTGGTLEYHIDEEIKRKQQNMEPIINYEQKKYITYHLALAIEALHLNSHTHGDLKPNNIVLTRDGHVRLIDFGLASYLQDGKLKKLNSQSLHFASPEVWKKLPAGLASDWWSFGVIIAYFYQLRLPFQGSTEEQIRELADSGKPSLDEMRPQWMGYVKEFILELLVVDPDKRLTNVSSNEFFGVNGDGVTQQPFKPGDVNVPAVTPSEAPEYFSDDPEKYEILESNVIRIPPPEFFASDYYKSI